MKQISVSAVLKIKEGKLAEFKQLATKLIAGVKEKDTGTLVYDWYLNESTMECAVMETYADSQAAMAHMGNAGEHLPHLMELCDMSFEVYGNPSAELSKALEGLSPRIFPYFAGL